MARYTGPRTRIARKFGEAIFNMRTIRLLLQTCPLSGA